MILQTYVVCSCHSDVYVFSLLKFKAKEFQENLYTSTDAVLIVLI